MTKCDFMEIEPLKDDIRYRRQSRKKSAASLMNKNDIAGADFETVDGDAWLFTLAHFEGDEVKSNWIEFNEENPFNLSVFIKWISNEVGSLWRKGGGVKGITHPYLYFWNMTFDASSIIKSLSDEAIDELLESGDTVVNAFTHQLVKLEKKGNNFIIPPNMKESELVALHYLPRKYLRLKPLGSLYEFTDSKDLLRRRGVVEMFDMAQFYGCSLKVASSKAIDEGLIDEMKLDSIDASRINDADYRMENYEEIIRYGLVDAEVTLKLSWFKVQEFEGNGVRMIMPYSLASVAERNLLDTSDIPTLDDMMANNRRIVMMAWNSYRGGWFECLGSGKTSGIRAFDLASAYPYIMAHLPDFTVGYWSEGDETNSRLFYEWLEERQPYSLGFAECIIQFPAGMKLYPGVMMSSKNCTMTPRNISGWFCADEIIEFQKWGATIFIDRWCCHYPKPGAVYPLRDFINRWYEVKYAEGKKKGTADFDKAKYAVSKVCLNSIYGKLIQTVEKDDFLKPGKLWNPIWGAVITGATRARMAEFARLNSPVYAVATDGIVVQDRPDLVIPDRPLESCRNLGMWEEETPKGGGDLLAIMSGVYSIIAKTESGKTKTTTRGNASLFIGRHDPNCNPDNRECEKLDCQPMNWLEFCELNGDFVSICRDEHNHPFSRPYSLGEARMKGDYSLVNQFRVVKATIKVVGDSNKRLWMKSQPTTFNDLMQNWYESSPHSHLL